MFSSTNFHANDSPGLKIGLISDLHLNLKYNEHYGPRLD